MKFKTTPEFTHIKQEYERRKNDMLSRGNEEIYDHSLDNFIMEQVFYYLAEYMADEECAPPVFAVIAACIASGKGFLAQLVEWANFKGQYDFLDTQQTMASITEFAHEVNAGEWELGLAVQFETDAEKYPAKVLDSHLMIPCESYQKVVDALRGFSMSITFSGVVYTLAKVAFADIANTSINELDAEARAAAPYIAAGYIQVLGRLGPWYWLFHDGEVAVEYHGAYPISS